MRWYQVTDKEFIDKLSNKKPFTADELNELISKCDVADRLYMLSIINCFNSNDLDGLVYTIYRLREDCR